MEMSTGDNRQPEMMAQKCELIRAHLTRLDETSTVKILIM